MVEPERLTPGRMAKAWAQPITRARQGAIGRGSQMAGGPPAARRAARVENSTRAVTSSPAAAKLGEANMPSIASLASSPTATAGSVPTARPRM